MSYSARVLASEFTFPEGPRWRNGHLWFADCHDGFVRCLTPDGRLVEQFPVPGLPSGIGWLPSGELLVVSIDECRIYIRRAGVLAPFAELRPFHSYHSNDMIVDAKGNAYVGNIGFRFLNDEEPRRGPLLLVNSTGVVSVAAENLMTPNGVVISAGGDTLVVAESLSRCLTMFDIETNGRLTNARTFADLGPHVPDGICLDAEGCIWVASPYEASLIRVRMGGEIVDRIKLDALKPYACVLGGKERRDLYICCAPSHFKEETMRLRAGAIAVARVEVPGAGIP